MGFNGPVGCRYEGWRAGLELHPDGLWTWEVLRALRVFEAEFLRYCRERASQHNGAGGDMERRLMDTYGDELLDEELDDGTEDPHRG